MYWILGIQYLLPSAKNSSTSREDGHENNHKLLLKKVTEIFIR